MPERFVVVGGDAAGMSAAEKARRDDPELRAVGRTVAGWPSPVGGIVGTGVMKTFDLEVARTGLDDEQARRAGFDPVSTAVTTITRAHYYPDWSRIVVRLVADAGSGRLLGAQLVGKEGAAHRVNAVATALHAGMTVPEVGQLDFGYSPPFGPVWDPVLLAAKALGDEMEANDETGDGEMEANVEAEATDDARRT